MDLAQNSFAPDILMFIEDIGMTDDENEDDDIELFPTFDEAKRDQKKYIAQLKEMGKHERRIAKVMEKCRKGSRCNHREYPVCARR